jgi:diguanylate cyclase (GGDEF)-like protein
VGDRQQEDGRLRHVPTSVALGVAVTAAGVFAVSTVVRPTGTTTALLDLWVYNLVHVAAAVVCLRVRSVDRRVRLAWRVFAGGLLMNVAGNVAFYLGDGAGDAPSGSDVLYLGWYASQLVTVALLLRVRVRRMPASLVIDGLVAGLGLAALGAAVVGPVLRVTGATAPEVIVGVAYPAADLLVLLLAGAGVAVLGSRAGPPLLLLAASASVAAVTDGVYVLLAAADRYVEGGPLDAAWPLSVVLAAVAASLPQDRPPAGATDMPGWTGLVVPVGAAGAALALLAYGQTGRLDRVSGVLATACLLATSVRGLVTFKDLRELADTRRQAQTDDLTGLGNRRQFDEHLRRALTERRGSDRLALLLVDLDRFKDVNDALGHDVGDELLRLVGPRLIGCLGPHDQLARLGGDEFAMLLVPGDRRRAEDVAARIGDALAAPFPLADLAIRVDASIGIALAPEHGAEAGTLLRRADVAMYEAKAQGSRCCLYSPRGDGERRRRLEMIEELRDALETGQVVVHHQPKVRLPDLEVVGVEALARWAHPTRGLLPPAEFLPLAEQVGLTTRVTALVLDRAVSDAAGWKRAGRPLPVAVNLSAADLLDPGLLDAVAEALRRHHLDPALLEIEITEGVLIQDPARAARVVRALRRAGHAVAIDDFGTGYSSLSYLRQLAVDELKLDQVFVRDLGRDPQADAIVRSTIELAHALDLRVVAEGVETTTALEALGAYGCDLAQGYAIARPLPPALLPEWLQARAGRRPVPRPVVGLRSRPVG